MIYQWKRGARKRGDAQQVGEVLERIRLGSPEERLHPRDIVVEACHPESPLHGHFEWRDHVAAKEYRLIQARDVIRSVTVRYEEAPDTEVPAFVCIEQGAEEFGPYQATNVALAEPDSRQYVLEHALRELASWRRKYADLKELADVMSVIDRQLELVNQ